MKVNDLGRTPIEDGPSSNLFGGCQAAGRGNNADMTTPSAPHEISFRQTFGSGIAVYFPDGRLAAEYRFGPELPKPCFHPLVTPLGHTITGFEMSDHLWHRGLWFAIKFLNKSNFWEENPPFGIQATRGQPDCRLIAPDAVSLTHALQWSSDATGPIVEENRSIVYRARQGKSGASGSGASGYCQIDWDSSLIALQDIELDRTPYTTWGGYSGITFRASRGVHGTHYLTPAGEQMGAVIGSSYPWLMIRGVVDGGFEQRVSLGIIDYPGNPRAPSPWYGRAGDNYDFMNAAFLFHEPMKVSRGDTLRFRYRVFYRDGWWAADDFTALADEFRKLEG
jgi:hypothetical protein